MTAIAGWALRFLGVLILVLATWNPEGRSFVHWISEWQGGITAPKAFTAVVLTIAWVAVFVSSWRSLGVIATGLLAALVGTGLWMLVDWSGATLSGRVISYVVLVSIAFVLSFGMSWTSLRASFAARRHGSVAADARRS